MILKNIAALACFIILALMLATPAHATKTVTTPYVTKGKGLAEFRTGYAMDNEEDEVFKTRYLLSYGFTDFYNLKIGLSANHSEENDFTDVGFENKFQLLPKGEYFIDLGLRLDYSRSVNGGADEIGTKILIAKKIGEFSNTVNLEAGRETGEDSSDEWSYGLAYAIAHPLNENLSLGAEWYSDFGDFKDDYEDQKHQVGPVLYGNIAGPFDHETGILFGISDAAPDAELKTVIKYGF